MSSVNHLNTFRTTVLVAATIGLEACIVVPIPYPPATDEVFIQQEKIDEVEIGKTDYRELQRMLGGPDWSFDSASRMIYKTRTLSQWQLGGCFIGMDGSGGCDDRWYKTELLDVTIDSYGIVVRREVLLPDLGERTASGICLYKYDLMKVYAAADANLKAKEIDVSPGKCAVFLYSWKPARSETTVRFQVDGNEDPYWFLADSDFFRVDLAEGPHTIGATVNWSKGVLPNSIALNCESEDAYFIRILIDGLEGASFGLVPAEEGRREIKDRDLVLLKDSISKAN
jgi:hypothetical protein